MGEQEEFLFLLTHTHTHSHTHTLSLSLTYTHTQPRALSHQHLALTDAGACRQTGCTNCPAGSYSGTGSSSCRLCPSGEPFALGPYPGRVNLTPSLVRQVQRCGRKRFVQERRVCCCALGRALASASQHRVWFGCGATGRASLCPAKAPPHVKLALPANTLQALPPASATIASAPRGPGLSSRRQGWRTFHRCAVEQPHCAVRRRRRSRASPPAELAPMASLPQPTVQ